MTSPDRPIKLIVRRGALRRFHKLKQETQELPVEVTWDRRTEDRRGTPPDEVSTEAATDRRESDRRRKPSFTWELADFVVVPAADAAGAEAGPGAESEAESDAPATKVAPQVIPDGVELGPRPLDQRFRRKSR